MTNTQKRKSLKKVFLPKKARFCILIKRKILCSLHNFNLNQNDLQNFAETLDMPFIAFPSDGQSNDPDGPSNGPDGPPNGPDGGAGDRRFRPD